MSQADLISRGIKNKNKICSFSLKCFVFFFLESDTVCIPRNGYDRINKKQQRQLVMLRCFFLFNMNCKTYDDG